ncbi:MAG TPA: PGPGW domain-containing protein [Polyangiaceae bacterium]|nr:PGPGW domain-containing protein [Polyangiaceae bacterium]
MVSELISWFKNPLVEWGLGIFSVLAIVASVVLVPRFLASLPTDYLRAQWHAPPHSLLLRVARNALGVVLVLLGIAMLLLPGQGLLTLLVGLLLVDFPGKHQLVTKLLSRPKVLAVVNKLRAHKNAAPLAPA